MAQDRWMQQAFNPAHKGMLHRDLNIPQGQKIPAKTLEAAAEGGGKTGQRARAALNAKRATAKSR